MQCDSSRITVESFIVDASNIVDDLLSKMIVYDSPSA